MPTTADIGLRPLASVWFGANDLFAAIGLGTPATSLAIDTALNAIQSGITSLVAQGVRDFVVYNLPDLGVTPLYNGNAGLAALASSVSEDFNTGLARRLNSFSASAQVTTIDINDLASDVLGDPNAFGLSNVTDACLVPGAFLCGAEAGQYAFFDRVHPNRVIHAEIASRTAAALAPIRLPAGAWLLLTGLGWVSRRQRP